MTTIQQARDMLVGVAIPVDDDPDAERVFVVMDDVTAQVCAVFARDADQAREVIAGKLGRDVGDQPVYDVAKDDDVRAIINIIDHHTTMYPQG